MLDATKAAFQKLIDGDKSVKSASIVSDAGTTNLIPTPSAPPAIQIKNVPVAAPSLFAYVQSTGDFVRSNECIAQGGYLRSIGGVNVILKNVYSTGAPHGSGVYFIVVATGSGRQLVWDNSAVKNKWIFNGNEAALRIMGKTKTVAIAGVDLCCRKHNMKDNGTGSMLCDLPIIKPDGSLIQPVAQGGDKLDWWKQSFQLRDCSKFTMSGGRIIGPWVVGEQDDADSPQFVGNALFQNVGMTHDILISKQSTIGNIVRQSCYKIDETGMPIIDPATKKPAPWVDKTWMGEG